MISRDPKWLREARKHVGLLEIKGQKHNPKIVQFFKEVGHSWVKDDETAWCAAFLGAMLERAGIKSTRQLTARSYLNWGVPIKEPKLGCIAVLKRGTSNWQGHAGFYLSETPQTVTLIGGNQSNSVSIAKYNKRRLLGYRWPKEVTPVEKTKAVVEQVPGWSYLLIILGLAGALAVKIFGGG
jgi:uncharacterized protein (TIGR02594 family)